MAALGDEAFEAVLEGYMGFAFGGATLGCTALAAARSCPDRPLTSLHATFLRPLSAGVPVRIRVENVREGRRLAHRRATIAEHGRLGFELIARFASDGPGPELPTQPRDPAPPAPDDLPDEADVAARLGWEWWQPGVLEQRWVGDPWQPDGGAGTSDRAWVRPREPLPDDAAVQTALIAYLSDVHSHWPVARSLNGRWEPEGFTSLDTAIWFHRAPVWNDWWLLESRCNAGFGGRALSTRELRSREGVLVASMAQEALIPGPS